MNTHKISIVIPVYNDGEFIKDCLESVLLQNYKNFEIICVNDGSTDNTLDVLNEYAKKDERVIVIDKKVNEGTMLARKSGAEIATGSYITFIDCDDVIAEDFLYYINESINKYNADIMHFNIAVQDFFHNNGKIERKHSLCPINKTLNSTKEILRYTYLERKIHTALLGKAFRSEVCKKAFSQLPYEKNHVGEDVFSYLYLAYYANTYKGVCEIDKDLYIYRYGLGVSNSETMSLSKFEIYCKMSCWDEYAYEFAKNQPDNEYLIKAI